MTRPASLRVVGCGSPHGDDAAGWSVIDQLDARVGQDVSLHRAAGGHDLLELLDGRGSLILVDAVSSGAAPGTLHRFQWPDGRMQTLRPGSTHDLGLAVALRLADVLGLLPARVVVHGIEVGRCASHEGLTIAVADVLPRLVGSIVREIALFARHEA